jgi:hypothetical protein
MNEWQMRIANGECPKCHGKRPVVDNKSACAKCLKTMAKACRRWRVKNKDRHNAYMREYMRNRRLAKPKPARAPQEEPQAMPPAPSREWLLARLEALQSA